MNKAEQMGVSRTRPSGHTVRTVPPIEVIQAMRDLVETKSYGIINGVAVDTFTASGVVALYDHVNEANKQKLSAMSVDRMIAVTYSTMQKLNAARGL